MSSSATAVADRKELLEVYKASCETWRSQVNSSWQRSNYFAAFETAAIAGCWHLVSSKDILQIGAGVLLSILGICLTRVWYKNNEKMHGYVRHWWDSIRAAENGLGLSPYDFAEQLEHHQEQEPERKKGQYRELIQEVPKLFGIGWIVLFAVALIRASGFLCP